MTDIFFDDFESIIKGRLMKAKNNVKIAVAWINFNLYSDVFNRLLDSGVYLSIIINDDFINNKYLNLINIFRQKGADIKLQGMATAYQKMHHKFCIVDNSVVLLGSYNWSTNASKNFENLLITDESIVIQKLNKEFELINIISKDDVRQLQFLPKCSECGDFMINIMVLNSNVDRHYSTEMKIISTCTCRWYEVKSEIVNEQFYFSFQSILDKYSDMEEDMHIYDYENENLDQKFDFEIQSMISQQFGFDNQIHAVGVIGYDVLYPDGNGEWVTNILWKNRFVAKYIKDKYHDSFNLV